MLDEPEGKLIALDYKALSLRTSNPEQAFEAYKAGRLLAEQLKKPCWVLHFAQGMANVCIYELEDLDRAMALCVKGYMLSVKPEYKSCASEQVALQRNLLELYLYYDPVGHQKEILQVLDFLEKNTQERWLRARLLDFRALLYLKRDDLDQALYLALNAVALGGESTPDNFLTLTRIYWERGEYDQALDASIERERLSQDFFSSYSLADARAWTAAMLRKTGGSQEQAIVRYRQATTALAKTNFVPNATIYDALADYHEAGGDMQNALSIRDQQRSLLRPQVGPDEMATPMLRRARLLCRMGLTEQLNEQLAEARDEAKRLRKPEAYLQKLKRIEEGDGREVIWKL